MKSRNFVLVAQANMPKCCKERYCKSRRKVMDVHRTTRRELERGDKDLAETHGPIHVLRNFGKLEHNNCTDCTHRTKELELVIRNLHSAFTLIISFRYIILSLPVNTMSHEQAVIHDLRHVNGFPFCWDGQPRHRHGERHPTDGLKWPRWQGDVLGWRLAVSPRRCSDRLLLSLVV